MLAGGGVCSVGRLTPVIVLDLTLIGVSLGEAAELLLDLCGSAGRFTWPISPPDEKALLSYRVWREGGGINMHFLLPTALS